MESRSERELIFANPPNFLTLSRIALVPVVAWALLAETVVMDWVAFSVFIVASITDYWDGYLARVRKEVTVYGKLLDPLADKFLVVTVLILLMDRDYIHSIVVILLICREIGITGLRALASSEGVVIAASAGGKFKTFVQMSALPILIAPLQWSFGPLTLRDLGYGLLLLSVALSLSSGAEYAIAFFRRLKTIREERRTHRLNRRRSKREQ